MPDKVYEGANYDGEYLISADAEAAIRAAVSGARVCQVPHQEACPHCETLIDRALRAVGANLYGVYG